MTIFDYLFDSEWSQRADINSLDERAKRLEEKMSAGGLDLSLQVRDLRRDVARLALLVETLADLVISKSLCTREEFWQHVDRRDREDGVADGIKTEPAPDEPPLNPDLQLCPSCQRNSPPTAQRCIYCGETIGFAE
jgi:hypothetical protein